LVSDVANKYSEQGAKEAQMNKMDTLWQGVDEALQNAHLIAFDGCHKIYLAMDLKEAAWFAEEYEHVFKGSAEEMGKVIRKWWDDSCGLKFISAVETNEDDPNAGFTSLISQFEWDETEEEDDEESEWS
jgi:hypothetical protein